MMRLLILLGLLIVIALLGSWLAANPANILVSVPIQGVATEIEMPLWFGLLGVFAIVIVAYAVLQILGWFGAAPKRMRQGRRYQKMEASTQAITESMIALANGNGKEALRKAKQVEKLLPHKPVLGQILMAQAALQSGDEALGTQYLRKLASTKETAFLGVRYLLGQAGKAGDEEAAYKLAIEAYQLQPKRSETVHTLLYYQMRRNLWEQAHLLLYEAERHRVLKPEIAKVFWQAILVERSKECLQKSETDAALQYAKRAIKVTKGAYVPAIIVYAQCLAVKNEKAALAVLEKSLLKTPHPAIALVYMDTASLQYANRVQKFVEKIEKNNAKNNIPTTVISILRGNKQAIDTWHCATCGYEQATWQAICPSCFSFDSFAWGMMKSFTGKQSLTPPLLMG